MKTRPESTARLWHCDQTNEICIKWISFYIELVRTTVLLYYRQNTLLWANQGMYLNMLLLCCAPATVIELLSGSLVSRLHQTSLLMDWRQKHIPAHSSVWEPQWISSHHLLTKLRMSKCFLWVCCVFLLHCRIFIICSLQFVEHDSWFKQFSPTLCSGGWLMYTHGHLVRCQKPATPAQLGCKNGSW